MKRLWFAVCVAVCLFCLSSVSWCQEPQKVTVCQLKSDPPAYDHKLIEVEGFVSSDFEDFTLFDPTYRSGGETWLEYGGDSNSGTMYCCGITPNSKRPQDLEVEGISVPLKRNEAFDQFHAAVNPPYRSGKFGSVVHATIVGRFFAGTRQLYGTSVLRHGGLWGGYGHMGCCSLLAIQEIKSVSPQDRDDLDYGASPDQPKIEKKGCGYSYLAPLEFTGAILEYQRQADLGPRAWAFDDPQRVAIDALEVYGKIEVPAPPKLNETRRAQGRIVYEWTQRDKSRTYAYMVVVTRPYWLSFYAHDPKRVAWVVVAAYELTCEPNNPATRTK